MCLEVCISQLHIHTNTQLKRGRERGGYTNTQFHTNIIQLSVEERERGREGERERGREGERERGREREGGRGREGNIQTCIEKEFDHLQMSLVAGQCEGTLLEFIRVCVDVSSIVQQQLSHSYITCMYSTYYVQYTPY